MKHYYVRVLEAAECDPSMIIIYFERSVELPIVNMFMYNSVSII